MSNVSLEDSRDYWKAKCETYEHRNQNLMTMLYQCKGFVKGIAIQHPKHEGVASMLVGLEDLITKLALEEGGGVNRRVIFDLCAGTGAWSQPYRDAG